MQVRKQQLELDMEQQTGSKYSNCEGEMEVALESLEGTRASRRVEEVLSRSFSARGNSRRATWVGPQAERPRFPGPLVLVLYLNSYMPGVCFVFMMGVDTQLP